VSHEVRLTEFSGPLELLLELIEKGGLEISTVSLAEVTGQYLASLKQQDDSDPATMAGFLHVASRLVLLKSRYLIRVHEPEEEETGEISLEEQLREYQRYRALATQLARLEAGGGSYPSGQSPARLPVEFAPISADEYASLSALYQEVLAQNLPLPEPETILFTTVSLEQRSDYLKNLLRKNRRLELGGVFQGCRSRLELVVTFLAVLEILKKGGARVWQETSFGAITLEAA
jgi:segregation and condensation protein A